VFFSLHRADRGLGIGNHRTEFQRVESPPVQPDARLREENWAAILEADRGGDGDRQRGRGDQARRGQQHVEQAFDHAARLTRGSCENSL
jgi:hypothetical protein